MKSKRNFSQLLIIALFTAISFSFVSFTGTTDTSVSKRLHADGIGATFDYSWSTTPGAIYYKVELENQSTAASFTWETTSTTITKHGIPSGNYDLTITAYFTLGSPSIVIEDDVIL